MRLFIFSLLLLLNFFQSAYCDEPQETIQNRNIEWHKKVLFGVYPISLFDFNLADHSYKVDFYGWWISDKQDYRPDQAVEITNSINYTTKNNIQTISKNGYLSVCRYQATMHKDWNILNFPFDRQILEVHLEDSFWNENFVTWLPDMKNSKLHSELTLEGWTIKDFYINNSSVLYDTNFGEIEEQPSRFSRLTLVFDIKRNGERLFFTFFIGFICAFFIVAVRNFIEIKNISLRNGLNLCAIFLATGNKSLIDSYLPRTDYLSLADAIEVATFLIIIFTTILDLVTSYLIRKKTFVKTTHISIVGTTLDVLGILTYIGFVGYYIFRAINS